MVRKSFYCVLWHIANIFGQYHIKMASKHMEFMQKALDRGKLDGEN